MDSLVDSLTVGLHRGNGPEFWSLEGVIALGVLVVGAGRFTDWLLRKHQKEDILIWMAELSERLANDPIRKWQTKIAQAGLGFWDLLEELGERSIEFVFSDDGFGASFLQWCLLFYIPAAVWVLTFVDLPPPFWFLWPPLASFVVYAIMIGIAGVGKSTSELIGDKARRDMRVAFHAAEKFVQRVSRRLAPLIRIAEMKSSLPSQAYLTYTKSNTYYLSYMKSITDHLTYLKRNRDNFLTQFADIEMPCNDEEARKRAREASDWIKQDDALDEANYHLERIKSKERNLNSKSRASDRIHQHFTANMISNSPFVVISTTFTVLALLLGLHFSESANASYWFAPIEGSLVPQSALLLALVNFPFDVLTLVISMRLLRSALKGMKLELVAMIDLAASGILVVFLHTLLKTIEPGGMDTVTANLQGSASWFWNVVTLSASPDHADAPLTPVLFTTFIPVGIYMSIFLFLGLIVRPLTKLGRHLCDLFWEREQTPFLELAIALWILILIMKALFAWDWFEHWFH